jgi:hypothetical protein
MQSIQSIPMTDNTLNSQYATKMSKSRDSTALAVDDKGTPIPLLTKRMHVSGEGAKGRGSQEGVIGEVVRGWWFVVGLSSVGPRGKVVRVGRKSPPAF